MNHKCCLETLKAIRTDTQHCATKTLPTDLWHHSEAISIIKHIVRDGFSAKINSDLVVTFAQWTPRFECNFRNDLPLTTHNGMSDDRYHSRLMEGFGGKSFGATKISVGPVLPSYTDLQSCDSFHHEIDVIFHHLRFDNDVSTGTGSNILLSFDLMPQKISTCCAF